MESSTAPKPILQYFGTELDAPGHYFWSLMGKDFYRSRMDFVNCPFNPEALPYKAQRNGEAHYYQFAGFSIWAIEGGPKDTRPGSKSIFFVEQQMTKEELKALILANTVGKKITGAMPFDIQW